MNLKPYPEYKESGVEWLGAVPSTWVIAPLGHFFNERKQIVSDRDYAPLSVTREGVLPQLEHVAKTDNGDTRRLVLKGDFAINSRSDRKGSAGVADRDGSVSVITTVLVPRGLSPSFVHHLLRSVPFQEEYYRHGSGIVADLWSTRWSSMKAIQLAMPQLDEQLQIADYLDRETAEIDAFIADQEQLITLLTERRTATISHAVTKGLDPNAPMKDSGVEWLGEVPAHWRVAGLRRFAKTSSGSGFPHEYQGNVNEEIPFLKVNALGRAGADGTIRIADNTISRITATVLRAQIFPAGTIVIAKIGAALLLGRVCRLSVDACIDNNMMGITPAIHVDPAFLRYSIQTVQFEPLTNPGAVPSLSDSKFSSYALCWPSLDEQKAISEYLDRETSEIDATIADAREAIALSRERRAALISAAVTGKIDVRGHEGVG